MFEEAEGSQCPRDSTGEQHMMPKHKFTREEPTKV